MRRTADRYAEGTGCLLRSLILCLYYEGNPPVTREKEGEI